MSSQLSLYVLSPSDDLSQAVVCSLDHQRYFLHFVGSDVDLIYQIRHRRHQIDGMVLEYLPHTQMLLERIQQMNALLPLVLVGPAEVAAASALPRSIPKLEVLRQVYHPAIAVWTPQHPETLDEVIQNAIADFLNLPASTVLVAPVSLTTGVSQQSSLITHQRRLATKLQERLGYLGVYYKRNSEYFLRNMSPEDRTEFLHDLKLQYREIVLNYFAEDNLANQRIDEFVNTAFFADTSVPQIVEIHMELMDEFAKQLQLEGRSEELLLDYRLTLIDVIAHLCEMYRRSIPRQS